MKSKHIVHFYLLTVLFFFMGTMKSNQSLQSAPTPPFAGSQRGRRRFGSCLSDVNHPTELWLSHRFILATDKGAESGLMCSRHCEQSVTPANKCEWSSWDRKRWWWRARYRKLVIGCSVWFSLHITEKTCIWFFAIQSQSSLNHLLGLIWDWLHPAGLSITTCT